MEEQRENFLEFSMEISTPEQTGSRYLLGHVFKIGHVGWINITPFRIAAPHRGWWQWCRHSISVCLTTGRYNIGYALQNRLFFLIRSGSVSNAVAVSD